MVFVEGVVPLTEKSNWTAVYPADAKALLTGSDSEAIILPDDVTLSVKVAFSAYVTKTCYDSKDELGKYCRINSTPKTETSRRVIPLPKQIIPLLKETKKKNNSKYVVGNGDRIISVRSYQRSFELLLKKLNIQHHGFHALRHTFATRAIECGMDVKSLSEILGHKNSTITLNRYVHSFMAHKRDFMNRLGKIF